MAGKVLSTLGQLALLKSFERTNEVGHAFTKTYEQLVATHEVAICLMVRRLSRLENSSLPNEYYLKTIREASELRSHAD